MFREGRFWSAFALPEQARRGLLGIRVLLSGGREGGVDAGERVLDLTLSGAPLVDDGLERHGGAARPRSPAAASAG